MKPFTVDTETKSFAPKPPPPAGSHAARLVWLVDLGTQEDTWQGETKIRRKIHLTFELVNELMEDGRPFVVGRSISMSFNEKSTLRAIAETLLGSKLPKDFDLSTIIGKPCLAQVVHYEKKDGTTGGKLGTIIAAPKGFPVKNAANECLVYNIHEPDANTFQKLPKWIQEDIGKAKENDPAYNSSPAMQESDIPF